MEKGWRRRSAWSPRDGGRKERRTQQVACCRIMGKAGELDLEARRER